MKVSTVLLASIAAITAEAAYPGDIVQYWIDQTALLTNGTVVGGLQTPVTAWSHAIVTGAMYIAAYGSKNKGLDYEQAAVSSAAHNALQWVFHGTRSYNPIDTAYSTVLATINLKKNNADAAHDIGAKAALQVIEARTDDGMNNFVLYEVNSNNTVGVYVSTSPAQPVPDDPQAPYVKLFFIQGSAKDFRAPPPPSTSSDEYKAFVTQVKDIGASHSSTRTEDETNIALFWRESSIIKWNRIANAMLGNLSAKDVLQSATLYAQLNAAMANAAFASWDSKWFYNTWRPESAFHRTDIWLKSGHNISDPSWQPLLHPTPVEQEYTSGHGTTGAAAATVLRAFNGNIDDIRVTVSSNVTQDNIGVLTRSYINLTAAGYEIGNSRVYGGIHFQFSVDAAFEVGTKVGQETVKARIQF